MKERIQQFLNYKQITPAEFANSIKVQRSNITHLLQGRNQPGFQFITKMLSVYPEINAKWLIMGTGNMLEKDIKVKEPELFSRTSDFDISVKDKSEHQILNSEKDILEKIFPEKLSKASSKETPEIQSIVIFYTDHSFVHYKPSE